MTSKYRETVLEDNIRGWLRRAALQDRFRPGKLGDGAYEVSFPFIETVGGRAVKVITPLHLAQERPTEIIEHGVSWVFRLHGLKVRGKLPDQLLLSLDGLSESADTTRQNAFDDA